MKRLLVVVSAAFAAVSVQADTFVWNANGSGGWGAKERWFQSDGTTAATRAPTSGDTCNIPAGVEADVDDDDQAAFQSIDGVWLVDAASRVILAATNDFTVGCTIDGKGGVVKRNANKVTVSGLGKIKKTNGQSDSVADCAPDKGWFIEEGWVVAPQGGKVASTDYYTLGYLTIAAKGTCQMSNGMTFVIPGCDCAGLITNAPPTTTWQGVWFGRRYSSDICKVSGRLGGTKWGVTTWGRACLTGAESTVAGSNFGMSFHQATFNNGTLEIMKFGLKGQPSSIGLDMGLQMSYSGCMRYLGTGEITDKSFSYRAQRTYRNVVDGGAYGGLVFTSPWGQIQADDSLYLGRLALTGSNSVPCVIAGGWNQNVSDANGYFSTYVVKQGKGAWRIGDSDKNTQRGVFEVQEGALQFDRIAMTNATCSLGLSTVLYRDVGDNEPEKTEYKNTGIPRLDKNKVAYSVLLGGATTNVVFEYTGTNSSTTCSRKIALKGKGGRIRLSSDGEVRLFGGIYAEDTTDQTIVLDGEGAGIAEIGEITNGNARVSVVKDGSCTWTLRRNLTFGGSLEVRKGTLVVDAEGEPYNWYRFVVLTADKSYWGYANQLNLYDEGGKWCNANLSMRIPGWTDRTTYSYCVNGFTWQSLGWGECCWGDDAKHYNYSGKGMDNLFTGVGSSYAFRTYKDLSSTDPEKTAQKIVFRLPKGEKPAASFDLLNNSEGVKDFRLEGSTDGEEWTVLTTVTGIKNGSCWASSGAAKGADETAATHVVDTTAHPLFKLPTHAPVKSYAMLSNVTSVSVSRGATLKAKGDVMLPRLTVDCSAGGGTVDGFKFAPSGKIVLTNVPRTTEEIPLVFTNCSGLENVAGWAVEASRGTMTVRRTVEYRNGKLYAVAPGLTVIVR